MRFMLNCGFVPDVTYIIFMSEYNAYISMSHLEESFRLFKNADKAFFLRIVI